MLTKRLIVVTAMLSLAAPAAQAQIFGAPRSSAQRSQDHAIAQLPQCDEPLGSVTIADVDPADYEALDLQPPQALLRLVIQRSGCFTLVDRGSAAMGALQRERALASSGELQRNSNMGGGQMRAADYILLAEVASENANVSGANGRAEVQAEGRGGGGGGGNSLIGGLTSLATGGLIGGGRIGGGFNANTGEANTVLSLVNVRTTETAAVAQGYAAKRDVNWRVSGAALFGGDNVRGSASAGVGGYENTEMGRIVTQSFINAYAALVEDIRQQPRLAAIAEAAPEPVPAISAPAAPVAPAAPAARPAGPARPMRVTQTTTLRDGPQGAVVRVMQGGQTVFPTGKADGDWIEVIDEADESGWVTVERLENIH